jgi:hypothetical protein
MKKVSLAEIMGPRGSSAKSRDLSLDDLSELLGERLPKLEHTPVGRMRLITALQNRFGDNFRTLPGISKILSEFDDEARFRVKLETIKQIKAKVSK